MIWLAILLLAFSVFAGIYCSRLFNSLHKNGIVKQGGRVSLSKLSPELTAPQTGEEARRIHRCRRWYAIYVLSFFAAILVGIICIVITVV